LGNALRTLNVRNTPESRRRVIVRTQAPFVILLSIVLVAIMIAGIPSPSVLPVLAAWAAVVGLTVIGWFAPWESHAEIAGIMMASLDLAAIAIIAGELHRQYANIGIAMLVPVVILAFSFGIAGLTMALVGNALVTAFPYILANTVPGTPVGWINALMLPSFIGLVAIAAFMFSMLLQRSHLRLQATTRESDLIAVESANEQAITMTVLNAMDVGTAFIRSDSSVGFTNTAFRNLVRRAEMDPETMAGTLVFDTDRVTPVDPSEQMMEQAGRGDYFDSRLYWIGERAEQRAVLITARPVTGVDGEPLGSAFISKDVTELTDAIEAREDFLAGVSHELRTPLTSIIGYLEVIDDTIDAKEVGIDHELGIIQRNSNQLMMRIGDLLHITDESVHLRLRLVDVPRIVQQAVDAIRFRAENAGVAITASVGSPFTAMIDQSRFAQVLDNLLTNAVKYTPRGGSIDVTLVSNATSFEFTVADTGNGIPEHELKHVFNRFYRTESVRGGGISGAGLGLAIVQNIVKAHRGTVEVASEVSTGTTFTVTLPRRLGTEPVEPLEQ
jgi:signal transduction histidine kinase